MDEAGAVLSGPRGRRFCAEVACAGRDDVRGAFVDAARSPGDGATRRRWLAALPPAADTTEDTLLTCLADAVAHARYWQEPDEEDVLLTDPDVVAALRPVAQAVVASPTWQWWTSPLDADAQAHVQWTGEHSTDPPRLGGAADGLREWWRTTVEDERSAHERPDDPRARWSGIWWSAPAGGHLVTTSRARSGLGATQLMLTEDDAGWSQATVLPLRPVRAPRVYEVSGPQAWVDLVERHPLDVTRARRHDWWRTTGRDGPWLIPDWSAVATEYDAVHLTVAAYLAAPGRPLPVAGGATVIAGWDPDATHWLADVLEASGEPVVWERDDSDEPWRWRWRPSH
ncbi:hypothetical protein [Pseudonocardia nigra]|uniref:hypothetical protein n=1 Tax=Pseudonocardia nigra TaxID=1921578 RepID=UPI001C5F5714|nr:hypothetical protein [Pseudonocardia nigra]